MDRTPRRSMQFDAPFGELNWKRRRMRTFFLATLNCFVRTNQVFPRQRRSFPRCMRPARNVCSYLIRHAKRQPIQFDAPDFVKWKTYSWQSFRNRRELIGLKWPNVLVSPSTSPGALRLPLPGRERMVVRVARVGFSSTVSIALIDPVNRVFAAQKTRATS